MKLNIETREDHQAKIVAEFEPAELTQYKGRAARKIASKALPFIIARLARSCIA